MPKTKAHAAQCREYHILEDRISRSKMALKDANINASSLCLFSLQVERLDEVKSICGRGFPEVITRLPEADIQLKGVRAWILQGEKQQLVFFEMESSAKVPEHTHDYSQWGIMIEGKMELIIEGTPRICEKGDEYVIPAQAKHYAKFLTKSRVIDFFSERNRYRTKPAR
jgi:quercetin dioxygenase-like cupin family protein